MRALVAFYSVTGTTSSVAERIAAGLEAAGVEVVLHDLFKGPVDAKSFDVVGIGFPVHYYREAAPVARAIQSFGRLDGRSAFLFALHGTHRGGALNRVRRMLRRSGANVIGVFHARGAGRFLGYIRLGYEFSPDRPSIDELAAAEQFGRGLVAAHASARLGSSPPPTDPRTPLIYALERLAFSPSVVRSVYSRVFRADPDRCNACGRCSRVCPSNNITWHKGEQPRWARDCIGCFACAETCPKEAIRSVLDWVVLRPFLAYNVQAASRDSTMDYARVELRRGRIERLSR